MLDEVLAICEDRNPSRGEVAALCAAFDSDHIRALDAVALSVAQRYLCGEVAFEVADALVNGLWSYALSMAKDGDRLPDLMCNIYDAFDAGEYQHREDPPDTDPEIKYTRPLLTKVLTRCGAT